PEPLWVLMAYYGTTSLMNWLGSHFGNPYLTLSPFLAGTIALGLCFGAYATEVFRGALLSLPPGQREAGLALGMSRPRIFWRITLPQLWRVAVPGVGNLYLVLLQDNALVPLISPGGGLGQGAVAAHPATGPSPLHFSA